jgi:tRNA1Val (adenine37-N6)-methyltransferase
MANSYFRFKQFTVHQELAAMKVTTDGCLFGAWVADQLKDSNTTGSILDIGAGTGLLSLMLAQKNNAKIDAIEIDDSAATQAAQNFAASPWHERMHVINQDINLFEPAGPYDTIISNPPFYENDLSGNNRQKNIAHHDSGLLLQDLIRIISQNLTQTGSFYLLLPFRRYEEALSLIKTHQLQAVKVCLVRQSETHPFFRIMISGGKLQPAMIIEEEIAIKDVNNAYSGRFGQLLADYYLYL